MALKRRRRECFRIHAFPTTALTLLISERPSIYRFFVVLLLAADFAFGFAFFAAFFLAGFLAIHLFLRKIDDHSSHTGFAVALRFGTAAYREPHHFEWPSVPQPVSRAIYAGSAE
jgi:hypothetical protein